MYWFIYKCVCVRACACACLCVWVCVCRDDMVDLVGSYQFDDLVTEGGDVFARDPYILRFRCLNTGRWQRGTLKLSEGSTYIQKDVNIYIKQVCVCVFHDYSAERPGDDPSSHQTRGLGEGAGWALRCFPECQEEVENRCKFVTSSYNCSVNSLMMTWELLNSGGRLQGRSWRSQFTWSEHIFVSSQHSSRQLLHWSECWCSACHLCPVERDDPGRF